MNSERHTWQVALLVVGVLAVAAIWGVVLATGPEPDVSQGAASEPTIEAPEAPTLNPVPDGATVLIFGDSFTFGFGADDPATQGYAPKVADRLGWDATIDGLSGSGYVTPGPSKVTYLQRFRSLTMSEAPALVVLQGSINDQEADSGVIAAAVQRMVSAVEQRWPDAQVLMFGPVIGDPSNAGSVSSISQLDATLADVAAGQEIPYVDAVPWVTVGNAGRVVSGDQVHPSTAGHAYLARRFAASVQRLTR